MNATQIVLIVFIVALIVIYPIMIMKRNKKQSLQMQEQTNSLKRGDKVLTTSGVYGTIVDLHQEGEKTIVTIETGTEKNRGYISFDAYAIYNIIKDEVYAEGPERRESEGETAKDEVATNEVDAQIENAVVEKEETQVKQPQKEKKGKKK